MGDFAVTFFDNTNFEIAPDDRSPNYQTSEKKKFMIKRWADEEDITFTLKNRDYRGREVKIYIKVDDVYSMEFMLSANKTIVIRGDEIFTSRHYEGRRGMSEIKFWAFTDDP